MSMLASAFGLHAHNVSPIEALWFAFGFIGAIVASLNYRESGRDLQAIEDAGVQDKTLAAIANGHLRTEINRMLIHAIVMIVGVLAMLTPPTVEHAPVSFVGIIVTMGLFAISAITIAQSVLDRRLRYLLEALEASKEVN